MLLEVVLILSLGLSCWRDHLLIMAKGQDQIHSLLLSSRQPLSAVDLDYLKIAGEVCLGPSSSFSMPACSSCYPILVSIICVITLLIDHHSRAHFQHPIPPLPCIHPRPLNPFSLYTLLPTCMETMHVYHTPSIPIFQLHQTAYFSHSFTISPICPCHA